MSKQASSLSHLAVGQRFQADGNGGGKGTIRFLGPIDIASSQDRDEQQHKEEEKKKKKAKLRYFVGVEWDDEGRGKNDGSTGGTRYFECAPGMGSFVHPQRVTAARTLFDAVDDKYRSEFEAADSQRSLLAQNEPGGRTFEVPVVFAGHLETHEKLRDVGRLTHVVLNDAGVASLGDEPARLRELLPSCTELDLGNNLLSSWDDVAAVAEALDLVELRLSSNPLAGDVPAARLAEAGSLARVERLFLNQVPRAWDVARRLDAAGALPALRELHVCVNGVEALGDGDGGADVVTGFERLEFLNLTGNALREWSEVERLRELPALRRLMLNGNPLREMRYPGGFAALEWVSVRDCRVERWESVDRLNAFPALREIGMLRNPVSEGQAERDQRVEVVARVGSLRVMNHSEVSRRERQDAEKLYLLRCAEAAAARGLEDPPAAEHPRYAELVAAYGKPARQAPKVQPALKGRLVTVRVYDGTDEDPDACKTKKVPKTMTVGNLKALVMRLYRVPPPRQELLLVQPGGADPVPLDDTIKQLTYYNIEGEASVILKRV